MSLSAPAVASLTAAQTGEAWLVLLTLDHADLDAPIRVCNDAVDTVSRGETYLAFPFRVELPDQREERPPMARLTIDGVDRRIIAALREIGSPPTVTIEVVLGSSPDTVEEACEGLILSHATYDAFSVSGDLAWEPIYDAPYPADRYTPGLYPGLF